MCSFFKSSWCTIAGGNHTSCFLLCFCAYSLPLHPFLHLLRYKQKQMKEEMQRKIACDKYEASSTLTMLASRYVFYVNLLSCLNLFLCSAQDQYSSEYEMHVEEEKEEKEEGEAVAEAASLLMVPSFLCSLLVRLMLLLYVFCTQEAHGLDAEMHVLGGYEGLVLFGDGLNTKALAFTIDDSPKELICWHFNECIDCLIAFKPSSQILYTRCTVYWCLRTITYFNKAYSFIKRWYPPCHILLFCTSYNSFFSVMLQGQEIWSSFVPHATSRWPTHSSLVATTRLACSLVCSPHTISNK